MTRPFVLTLAALLIALVAVPAGSGGGQAAAVGATLHVAPDGSDTTGDGSEAKPWQTIQAAVDAVAPGDTVLVAPGTYTDAVEMYDVAGTADAPVTFKAGGEVVIDASGVERDAVLIAESSYVVWEGFRIENAPRAGLRVSTSDHVTVEDNVLAENTTWGLFTDFADDLLIEGNESFGADEEHGIYVSNSGDRPVLRGNAVHDNAASGIQLNADATMGGDGVITGAVIEGNVITGNGVAGGAALNLDGVEKSTIRNNVISDTHASGIALFQNDGAICSSDNLVQHNTVMVADDGRWAMTLPNDGCTGNRVESNIPFSAEPYRGALSVAPGSQEGLVSDHNVLEDRFTTDDGESVLPFAEWQALGFDADSIVADPDELFVDPAAGDLHLKPGSPAIDAGVTIADVTTDIDGGPRPQGPRSDAGAYEFSDAVARAFLRGTGPIGR